MRKEKSIVSHVTTGDVLLDLGFSVEESASLRARGEVMVQIQQRVKARKISQKQLAGVLGVHQPDVSHLLRGHVDKFSLDRLVEFATRLGMNVQVIVEIPAVPKRAARRSVANAA